MGFCTPTEAAKKMTASDVISAPYPLTWAGEAKDLSMYNAEMIDVLKELADSKCVEFLATPFSYSLAAEYNMAPTHILIRSSPSGRLCSWFAYFSASIG